MWSVTVLCYVESPSCLSGSVCSEPDVHYIPDLTQKTKSVKFANWGSRLSIGSSECLKK